MKARMPWHRPRPVSFPRSAEQDKTIKDTDKSSKEFAEKETQSIVAMYPQSGTFEVMSPGASSCTSSER
jgi:hypothetical protein